MLRMEKDDPIRKVCDEILARRATEVETVHAMSTIVHAGLSRSVIAVLLELIELGVDPESLADGKLFAISRVL